MGILELDDTKRLICNNCIEQLEICLKFREQVETSLKALEVTVKLKSKLSDVYYIILRFFNTRFNIL